MPHLKKLFSTYCFLFLLATASWAQSPAHSKPLLFYQLNSLHGLSGNYINAMCTDKNGNLWIGTAEGLNRFNGKTVTKYLAQEYPQLANNNIQALVTDSENRIWIRCEGGVIAILDEDRRFHKLALYENNKKVTVRKIMHAATLGIVLYTDKGFYTYSKEKNLLEADSVTRDFFSPLAIAGRTVRC
jgi:ligand-binding sensor domain-containing protein